MVVLSKLGNFHVYAINIYMYNTIMVTYAIYSSQSAVDKAESVGTK